MSVCLRSSVSPGDFRDWPLYVTNFDTPPQQLGENPVYIYFSAILLDPWGNRGTRAEPDSRSCTCQTDEDLNTTAMPMHELIYCR